MYLAVWLEGPDVKVGAPPLRRLNGALAVLRAHSRDDLPGLVFSGAEQRLRGLCEALEATTWPDNVPDVLHVLYGLARRHRISVVTPTTAAVTTVPRVGRYPRHISKKGRAVWDVVVDRHKQQIRRYGGKKRQWAAAIILYRRYAAAQGIEPFRALKTTEQKLRDASRDDIRKKIQMGSMRAGQDLEDLIKDLGDKVLRLKDEKFKEVAREGAAYFITTQYPLLLRRNVTPVAALGILMAKGWAGQPGRHLHRQVDRHTHLLVEPKGPQLVAYVATMLTRDQVILVFEFPEDVQERDLLRGIEKAGRSWVRSGRVTWTAR